MHLDLLLSMLQVHPAAGSLNLELKSTLHQCPALVVLHELSGYFLKDDADTS